MANIRHFHGAFTGGEVTEEFFARLNDDKYSTGVAKMRNFIALPHGPARNRAGLGYVEQVKLDGARLIRFSYSTTQTMVIEMGAGYFRFHTMGATLVDEDENPYEVANSYEQKDLFSIKYVQSNDILTLVHPSYPPMELRRYGVLDWRFVPISFSSPISAPATPTVTAHYGSSSASYTYSYVVTAVNDEGWESEASGTATVSGNLYATGAYNTISWGAVSGAVKYKVYKKSQGVFGYIGVTAGTSLTDDLITANVAKVPPEYDTDFSSANNYPAAVTYYEQRRVFANTNNNPQTLWMTKTGTESNMSMPIVTSADDAIEVRAATRDANTILHLVPLSSLVMLTSSTELLCSGASSGAVTQSNIQIKPQAYVGSSDVQPLIVNNIMLYVSARGNHVRELGYNWQANGMVTGDLSLRAPHLFDGKRIVDMAFSASPYPIAWFVVDSGELLGFTYIPEESIGGWHVHTTDGKFKSCCVVTEDNDDRLYVIVEREVNGQKKQYIERMSDMLIENLEDSFFVDSGATVEAPDGQTYTQISGIDWLEGKTVSILADGAVMPQQVVTNGTISWGVPAKKITFGLPYTSTLKTLPVVEGIDHGYATGRAKNINKAWMRVYRSSGIWAGSDESLLVEYKQRRDEQPSRPPEWRSQEIEITTRGRWTDSGQVVIQQTDPLPLTIVSITTEVSIGG